MRLSREGGDAHETGVLRSLLYRFDYAFASWENAPSPRMAAPTVGTIKYHLVATLFHTYLGARWRHCSRDGTPRLAHFLWGGTDLNTCSPRRWLFSLNGANCLPSIYCPIQVGAQRRQAIRISKCERE
uniref:(northern house mosquito) hypothetical protein n=1 Tax=Culex pipiens TaxID=7175 RepID=A0A8D8G0D1_CULPI